jgi:hypothetical protein
MRSGRALVVASLCVACGAGSSDRATPLLQPLAIGELASTSTAGPPPPLRAVEAGGLAGDDAAEIVAFDPSGARILYVVSAHDGRAWGYIERRSAGGVLEWVVQRELRQLGGVQVNRRGEVFVVDWSDEVPRVWKIGADGETRWSIDGFASPQVLPLSDGGVVVMDGAARLLRRFDADGVETMARTFFCDRCVLVATTDDELVIGHGVYVRNELNYSGCALVKIAPDLQERWRTEFVDPSCGVMAPAPDGGVLLEVSEGLVAIGADGAVRFRRDLPRDDWGGITGIAVDPGSGRIALSAIRSSAGTPTIQHVHVLDELGEPLWTASTDAALVIYSLAFDPSGRLAVAGQYRETDFLGRHHVPNGFSDAFYLQFER